jgi:hypothetical protein
MSLPDDIIWLRDRVLSDLNSAHDYYTDTELAWELVRRFIGTGQTLSIRNLITGTTTTQVELFAKSRGYVAEQLAEATFQQFISIFENYLFDLMRLWLLGHPKSLSGRKLDFKDVLDAADKDAIIARMVSKEVNEVLYDRPTGWFEYLEEKVKLGCPSPNEIARIAEAKASRDVLIHNRGVANKIYESKAGPHCRFADGQRIDIPEHYHRETWELLRKVVTEVSNAAISKAS